MTTPSEISTEAKHQLLSSQAMDQLMRIKALISRNDTLEFETCLLLCTRIGLLIGMLIAAYNARWGDCGALVTLTVAAECRAIYLFATLHGVADNALMHHHKAIESSTVSHPVSVKKEKPDPTNAMIVTVVILAGSLIAWAIAIVTAKSSAPLVFGMATMAATIGTLAAIVGATNQASEADALAAELKRSQAQVTPAKKED